MKLHVEFGTINMDSLLDMALNRLSALSAQIRALKEKQELSTDKISNERNSFKEQVFQVHNVFEWDYAYDFSFGVNYWQGSEAVSGEE